jgi:tellurite resistance protein
MLVDHVDGEIGPDERRVVLDITVDVHLELP